MHLVLPAGLLWSLLACTPKPEPDCTTLLPEDASMLGPRHEDPWQGEQRAVVLLLDWPDAPQKVSAAAMQETFFGDEGSLASWFREASNGHFTLTGTVLPWRTAPVEWASMKPKEPGAVAALASCLHADAIDIAGHDSQGNGRIDHLFVVHAGTLPRDRMGPKVMFASGPPDRTAVFQSRGLGSVGTEVPLGFYVHEAGHRYFALRDRYGDHHHGDYGIGVWGLMGLGMWGANHQVPISDLHRYPVHPRARVKLKLGWGQATIIHADATDVALPPIEGSGQMVRIPAGEGTELVLENRSPTGFHAKLPGHGLLIWREPVSLAGPVELIQADGRQDLAHGTDLGRRPLPPLGENFGDASDPFPGSGGVTEWLDPVSGIRIYGIRQEAEGVRFSVDVPPLAVLD